MMSTLIIKKIHINGQVMTPEELSEIFSTFSDFDLLIEKGGFLFRSLFHNEELHIGILPCILNGRKTFHYETILNLESEFTLIGWINSSGVFSIMFRPMQKSLPIEKKREYLVNYLAFSTGLLNNGFNGSGKLDFITIQILKGLDVKSKIPTTLLEFTQMSYF